MVVLKELNFNSFQFERCGGLEWKFLLWEGVVVLKELIFNSFSLWEGGCGGLRRKNSILTVSDLGGCGGFERSHF